MDDPSRGQLPITTVINASHPVENPATPAPSSDLYDSARNAIVLSCGIGEVTAFQYILAARSAAAVGVEILPEQFTCAEHPGSRISAGAVRMYRHWPITVNRYPNWYLRSQGLREPREIPDALVPISARNYGQPFSIRPGRSITLWVEIKVPSDAAAGLYQGGIVLRDAGGRTSRTPIELTVRNIRPANVELLPAAARVQLGPIVSAFSRADPSDMAFALRDSEARKAILRTFAILQEHGLSPYTSDVYPRLSQTSTGEVRLDWREYDEFCGPLVSGSAYADGRGAAYWPLPVDERQPDPLQHDGLESAGYRAVLEGCLARAAEHFAEKAWIEKAFVYFDLPAAAGRTSHDVEIIRSLCAETHKADARLMFLSVMIPQSMRPFGWFEHYWEDLTGQIDIWATPARYQHLHTLERLHSMQKKTWLPPDRPPYSGSLAVEAPFVHARSLPWQAFLQGHQALYLPSVTNWPVKVLDEPIVEPAAPSDTWLLYPGGLLGIAEPIPSVRLKQLQLGLQDYRRLMLLRRHGRGETARLVASSLIQAAGTDAYGDHYQDGIFGRRVDDPGQWQTAEQIILSELEDALAAETGTQTASEAGREILRSAWAKFLAGTRGVELRPESQRLLPDTREGSSGYLLTCEVSIRNELRVPVSGRLTFNGLPPGARNISDTIRVGPLQESETARRSMTAWLGPLPPTDLDGHYLQKLMFDAGFSGKSQSVAVVSVLRSPRLRSKLVIDGNVGDWPPNEFNAAGDFRLINRMAASPGSLWPAPGGQEIPIDPKDDRPKPKSQTVAYFCRDDSTLFIGIHAAAPTSEANSAPAGSALTGNVVEYEDLMPLSGDLVEILIDPTNLGTRSEDLFHLVIKAGGGALFERGIGLNPPIGEVRPWPGALPTYATRKTRYGWSAEIAVPLDAFGAEALSSPIWGLNIARLEPIRGEYSDWARAPRYCYDPRTLGNLIWMDLSSQSANTK